MKILFNSFIVGMLLLCAARADESVDNPAYLSWSTCQVGSSITLSNTITSEGGDEKSFTTKSSLVSIDPEKCVVEYTMIFNDRDPIVTRQIVPSKITDPAAIKSVQDAFAGATDETLTTPAGTFQCKKVHQVIQEKGDVDQTTWVSEEVPGNLIKSIQIIKANNHTIVTELIVVDRK